MSTASQITNNNISSLPQGVRPPCVRSDLAVRPTESKDKTQHEKRGFSPLGVRRRARRWILLEMTTQGHLVALPDPGGTGLTSRLKQRLCWHIVPIARGDIPCGLQAWRPAPLSDLSELFATVG
jgi:hypothetical protein